MKQPHQKSQLNFLHTGDTASQQETGRRKKTFITKIACNFFKW